MTQQTARQQITAFMSQNPTVPFAYADIAAAINRPVPSVRRTMNALERNDVITYAAGGPGEGVLKFRIRRASTKATL